MRKFKIICSVLMILSGLAIMAYPVVSNMLYRENASKLIESYDKEIAEIDQEEIDAVKEAAKNYNSQLQKIVVKEESGDWKEDGQSYLDLLGIGSSIGYITIPKIDVNLPIYNGTSANVLQKGIGHIERSSFPLGGESTHSVLTGHRGMPDAVLFTDLDMLEKGDMFYLHVLDEVLAYQVDQVKVVEPDVTSDLNIVKGKDYCTLVTCTPYAINSHRLLVRGTRVPYTGEEEASGEYQGFSTGMVVKRWIDVWPFLVAAGVVVLGLEIIIMITLLRRYLKKHDKRKKNKKRKGGA